MTAPPITQPCLTLLICSTSEGMQSDTMGARPGIATRQGARSRARDSIVKSLRVRCPSILTEAETGMKTMEVCETDEPARDHDD
ncbi:hypothetical protein [Nitrobacter vulgaris]|uniref:hypothetical protein n=1 Tax=Nitrobacter vulgaris TaxID=29421 RepID=UPI00286C1DBB|nr:hypothetical protein [Nitrobacter vulgaris]